MRKLHLLFLSILFSGLVFSQTIDVLIKGMDDGIRTNKQQDYAEASMNAKLQAIERAGVEIKSITEVVNFQVKYDMVESKAKAVLLPGFQIMDMGYQTDGSYQVVLSGKVQTATAQQPSEEDKLQSLKNDINGTWQLKVSDQPNVQFVSITHYLQFGINPARKEANLLAECNHNTDSGMYYNGKLSQVDIKIDKATYGLDGSITSDGKRILGSFEKRYWVNWDLRKSNGTFEMVRQ